MTWWDVYSSTSPRELYGIFSSYDDACAFAKLKVAKKGYTNGCDLNVLFGKNIPDGITIGEVVTVDTRLQAGVLRLRNKNEQQEKDV